MTAAKANEKQTMRVTLSKRTSFRMGGMKQDERRAATGERDRGRDGSRELSELAMGLFRAEPAAWVAENPAANALPEN